MAASHRQPAGILFVLSSLFLTISGEVLFNKGTSEVRINFPLMKIQLPDDLNFPYFGQKYHTVYISRDGFVSFSEYARYVSSRKFTERDSKNVNAAEDYPFIAPFYYGGADLGSTLTGNSLYKGKIFYNVLMKGNPRGQRELREIGRNVSSSIPGVSSFDPTYALVVTWEKVTDQYNTGILKCTDEPGRMCQDNTFQAVITTDGKQSFAIFNYQEMNIQLPPRDSNYQAGFNGGFGRGWSSAIALQRVRNITQYQASDRLGRYIYQINEERIITGGCNNPDGILEAVPDFAGLLGGKVVEVTGPCFLADRSYSLVFGNSRREKSENCITEDYGNTVMKVRCEIPMLTERGQVPVFMKANDGKMEYNTTITIVMPNVLPPEDYVQLVDSGPGSRWNETSASSLRLQWNSRVLSNHSSAKVKITLRGYREDRKSWDLTIPLKTESIPNSVQGFQFNPQDVNCDENCQNYEVGVIEVKLDDPRMANKYRTLRSRPTPLAWLINKAMVAKQGQSWPSNKCQAWYAKDMMDTSWLRSLPACPCNLHQALVDFGRWQKDPVCHLDSRTPDNCALHFTAVHCVRSVRPNNYGAGNQCCYRADGTLIYSGDSYQGSTPDRSHLWGAAPYNTPNLARAKVPAMSHSIHDIMPFYYCCLLTNDCDKYMSLRPTRSCTEYWSPKQAMVYGQGNVRMFDNTWYYVCGEGDFILLQSTMLTIEGRFQKSPFSPNYNSTILTDVGIRAGNDVIEVKMKGPNADRSKRVLDVLVNGEYQFFDNGPLRRRDFTDAVLINSDDPSNTMESNVTVVTNSGVGIQVAEKDQRLCLLVMIPPKFVSNGLLGNWNNNSDDDLTPRGSNYPLLNRNPQTIYSQFVFSWAITKNKDTSTIVPFPVYATNKTTLCFDHNQPNSQCNGDAACNHDYWTTMNMTIAIDTLRMSAHHQRLQENRQAERSCGLLDVPMSIKSNYNYSLGNKVTLTGCRKGTLSGTKEYTCVATGKDLSTQSWSPEVTASCGEIEQANIGMIIGIVVAIAVILIIAIAVAVVLKKKRKGSMRSRERKKDTMQDVEQYSKVAQREPKL